MFGAAIVALKCGGDDWLQKQSEYTARGPVEAPIERPVEPRFEEDPEDFVGDPEIF